MPKGRRKLSDASRWRMKTWRYIQEACGDSAATVTQKTWRSPSPCDLLEDKCYFLEGSQWTMPEIKDEDEEEDGSETLAEPEFTGIWDQECRISEVSDDRKDSKPVGATKLEKEIFAQNLEKLHSGVIRKHRVCGREFKGCPFYSKPSLVHFKDFDVGKTYKKKMVLINAFYSINYCKLVGVSEHLKDFFTVQLPRKISLDKKRALRPFQRWSHQAVASKNPTGEGRGVFRRKRRKAMLDQTKINEDLEGEITFLSQIGSFSVPLKCSTKKCVGTNTSVSPPPPFQLALDKELIDFGTHVVGETISRTITLTNSGALGTRFQLCRSGSSDVAHAEMLLPSAEKMVCPPVLGISSAEKSSINSQRDSVVDKETVSPSRSEEVIQHSNLMPEKLRSDVTASVIQLEEGRMRSNRAKLKGPRFHLDARKHFLTVRTPRVWNGLPREVVEAPSVRVFKDRLDVHMVGMSLEAFAPTKPTKSMELCILGSKIEEQDARTSKSLDCMNVQLATQKLVRASASGEEEERAEKKLSRYQEVEGGTRIETALLEGQALIALPWLVIQVTEGDIAPFSSVKLQINFIPAIPGDVQADFKIVFDNPDCKPLCFSATAVSMAVPVWVPNPDVDLKICMYDRLYQDCIVIHSRATSALRLKFDVCKELANHMELLPKTGYIQAQSCFSVQLKFLPSSLLRRKLWSYDAVRKKDSPARPVTALSQKRPLISWPSRATGHMPASKRQWLREGRPFAAIGEKTSHFSGKWQRSTRSPGIMGLTKTFGLGTFYQVIFNLHNIRCKSKVERTTICFQEFEEDFRGPVITDNGIIYGDILITAHRSYHMVFARPENVRIHHLPRNISDRSCVMMHSLPEDAAKYFDEKTGVLEVPMLITVSDQSKPVEFTVHAIITTSDLEISPAELDFGYCSVYEAVRTKITITNKAMLPQEFGFVGPPAFVEIQPNDGFGILLPLESLDLDVIFKAKEAKEYSFQLTCKTEINRQFKLSCKAVGVHPPLQLSHSLVQFSATALNDVSTATLFVINSHVSLSQFNHAGPRIGSGEVAPVGPTSFQFLVPEDAPITIMPCVGTVLPGKKCLIEVSFRPVLCDQLIRLEAVNLLCQAAESKALVEKKARELELQRKKEEAMAGRKDGKKLASISFLGQLSKDKHGNKLFEPPSPEDICPDSEEYIAAHLSLVRSFSGRFDKYVIPCFVASGDIDEKKGAENLQYSPYNTLYLELHCPAVAPAVVVVSNNGKTVFNFGDVAIGHRIKKEVKIQNITQEQLTFFETLEIKSEKATLTLTLIGQGVIPSITCSIEGDVFNMGYVVAKEMATATFKIENTSPLPLTFTIHLESLSPNRDQEQQALPPFLTSRRKTNLVGTQNYSGLSVFSVTPMEGTIGLGKAQEFTVTFSPDHESLYYSDCIRVLLFGKEVIRVIQLKGAARNHMMFVEGGEPLDVSIESLAVTTSLSEELAKAESDKSTSSILLSLESVQSETLVIPAVRELKIGGIRTSQFASKKNVEFSWEGLQLLQLKGFTVDPVKGNVDRGQTKAVTVSWVPPAGSDLNQPVTGSATLVVRGDVKEIYSVYCVGRIVTKAAPADSKCPVAAASPDR
ncbi:Cilia- and flagella-associated protein 74 [Varanus komodoensis]|nr:Cilia- and flagella-associated protein 74 [Varanus komodoensis]